MIKFDIAVFAANEAGSLAPCIRALDRACHGNIGHISVILNGTTDNSIDLLRNLELSHASLDVYFCPLPDKSNAINHFLYSIRDPAAHLHACVDAYVKVHHQALQALADALSTHPHAHIASGVPLTGRSAKAIIESSGAGVRGNLFAMRPTFVERLVSAGLRLPIGLYRGDGLLGSFAMHDLDPANPWDTDRVVGVLDAYYSFKPLSVFRWRDIRRQYNRVIRQALGRVEIAAIQRIIYYDGSVGKPNGFSDLPSDGHEMVNEYLRSNVSFPPRPYRWLARYAIRHGSPTGKPITPNLVLSTARDT